MSGVSELLPCPFCGEARIFLNEPVGREKGSINCPACLAVMPGEVRGPKGRDELVSCWNTRAAIAAMPVSCPRPYNDDPQDLSADDCVRLGHCGCGHVPSLPVSEPGVREALAEAKAALTKIRACSIKGAEEGYANPELWGEALFLSHGDVHRALKSIDAALAPPSPEAQP